MAARGWKGWCVAEVLLEVGGEDEGNRLSMVFFHVGEMVWLDQALGLLGFWFGSQIAIFDKTSWSDARSYFLVRINHIFDEKKK